MGVKKRAVSFLGLLYVWSIWMVHQVVPHYEVCMGVRKKKKKKVCIGYLFIIIFVLGGVYFIFYKLLNLRAIDQRVRGIGLNLKLKQEHFTLLWDQCAHLNMGPHLGLGHAGIKRSPLAIPLYKKPKTLSSLSEPYKFNGVSSSISLTVYSPFG